MSESIDVGASASGISYSRGWIGGPQAYGSGAPFRPPFLWPPTNLAAPPINTLSTSPTTSVATALHTVPITKTSITTGLASSIDPTNGKTVTAFQVITTSISGQPAEITLYPTGNEDFGPSGATGKRVLASGTIIAIVLGALGFLLLLLSVALFLRRRRRLLALLQTDERGEGVENMRENQHAPETIRPFTTKVDQDFSHTISSKVGFYRAGGARRPSNRVAAGSGADPSSNSGPTPAIESPRGDSSPSGRIYQGEVLDINNATEAPPAYHSVITLSLHTSHVPG